MTTGIRVKWILSAAFFVSVYGWLAVLFSLAGTENPVPMYAALIVPAALGVASICCAIVCMVHPQDVIRATHGMRNVMLFTKLTAIPFS